MIRDELANLINDLEGIQGDVDDILSDENDYMWNIPENLQNSDRYCAAEEAVDNLESASSCIGDAIYELESAMGEDADE